LNTIPQAYKPGLFALIPRGVCTFVTKAYNIEQAGYSAIIIFNTDNTGKVTMSGSGNNVHIPVIMIDYVPAMIFLKLIPTLPSTTSINSDNSSNSPTNTNDTYYDIFIHLYDRAAPVPIAALNRLGEVQELGQVWNNISQVVLAQARYQDYYYELHRRVEELAATHHVVTIADQQPYWGSTILNISDYCDIGSGNDGACGGHRFAYHTTAFASMFIYFDARCLQGWDLSCPQWDKLLSIYACSVNTTDTHKGCSALWPPVEIVRTVTSYSRPHAGLVDITPFLFFLSNIREQQFNLNEIKFYQDGSPNFKFTVKIFLKRLVPLPGGNVSIPVFAYKLWSGDDGLTSTYNQRQKNYSLYIPPYVQDLALAGYITGHGWGKGEMEWLE